MVHVAQLNDTRRRGPHVSPATSMTVWDCGLTWIPSIVGGVVWRVRCREFLRALGGGGEPELGNALFGIITIILGLRSSAQCKVNFYDECSV